MAASCILCDDNKKAVATNVTNVAIAHATTPQNNKFTTSTQTSVKISVSTSADESLPLLEDLVLAEERFIKKENANNNNSGDDDENDDDDDSGSEKNTAKRTISSKFTGPIVVNDEVNLFTPADEFIKKQINVQIIEPEFHNNGQFLKETSLVQQENNTVVTSKTTTTTTTERPLRRKLVGVTQKSISSKFLAPIQAGVRLSDDDCDDQTDGNVIVEKGRKIENVNIQQNTRVQKVLIEPKTNLAFGARFTTSTTKSPCDQSLPCSSTPAFVRPTSTPRANLFQPTPYLPPRTITRPVQTVTPLPLTSPVPITTYAPKPIYIHTETKVPVDRIVQVPVEKIVKEYIPHEKIVPVEVEKLVVKEVQVPVNQVIEKHIQHAPNFIERIIKVPVPYAVQQPVEVEKVVTKEIPVPVDRIVERIVDRPYEVEKIVERPVPVQVNHILEKIVDRPVEVEKIVEKPVPYLVEKFVDRPIPYEVGYPIHIPFLVEVPVHAPYPVPQYVPHPVHLPVLVKPSLPPPKHFIIKTTKYGKHGFFDWKHGHHPKYIKHVFVKKPPNFISADEFISAPSIDAIGLIPPPRFDSCLFVFLTFQ